MIRHQERHCWPLPDFRQIGTLLRLGRQLSFDGPFLLHRLELEAGGEIKYLPCTHQGSSLKTNASAVAGLLETSGS